jgi:hypothetical protein
MMAIWFLISEEARQELAKLYRRLAGYSFKPPILNFPKVKIDPKLETLVKIERLVRRGK